MSQRWKRALHWAGSILALVGVAFVAQRLWSYGADIRPGRLGTAQWIGIAVLSVVYGASNLLLALAWRHLLNGFGHRRPVAWTVRVFGISQIAKYLPGNIFHLAGRQAMGMADGVPGWILARSMAWELGLLMLAGCLFLFPLLPLLRPGIPAAAAAAGFLLAASVCLLLLWRLVNRDMALAMAWHGVFLFASGLIFLATYLLVAPPGGTAPMVLLPLMVAAFVIAWLAGLLTPGAPAGVGVREMVMILLMAPLVPEAALVFAVVLSRIITVCGDTLFYLAAHLKATSPAGSGGCD
jgi:glycosyltransferase 2 family protein